MATEPSKDALSEIDPDESPFELQAIEGLPLTDHERREIERLLSELDRERTATRRSGPAP